ncbi:MAG: hypothetical protein M0R48_01110 [Candidatus Omnitrophica bacterium]|jgi:transglutaminase-like putative cysteine protease|nr:hypothetical protein [Candidatus Omnitrophota bacterium]
MNSSILDRKFNEWTKNFIPLAARISVFNHIRDIPYIIVPELRDPKVGTSKILELNKGSCQPKHFLLAVFFERLSIPVKYVSYPFKWGEQPLKFPNDLRQLAKSLPISYHLACKAYVNNKWILVDATNDLALEKAGFPVTNSWDGINDTKNAVVPIKEIIHRSLDERVAYELAQKSRYTDEEKLLSGKFVEELNSWLYSIRKK